MRVSAIYVRFYKSFNFDYERKFAQTSRPDPWEYLEGTWYPYVRMELDPSITTIVGANESGKSHLLDAIEKLITGKKIERRDFCRYSHFFSVEQGKLRFPDFGGKFEVVNTRDVQLLEENLSLDLSIGDSFYLFRPNGEQPIIYLADAEEPIRLSAKQDADLKFVLPSVFRLNPDTPLPASIPLRELASAARRSYGSRRARGAVFENFFGRKWMSADELTKAVPNLFPLLSAGSSNGDEDDYQLGRALLFDVAKIDAKAFEDLAEAIADENEGYVNGVIQKMNAAFLRTGKVMLRPASPSDVPERSLVSPSTGLLAGLSAKQPRS